MHDTQKDRSAGFHYWLGILLMAFSLLASGCMPAAQSGAEEPQEASGSQTPPESEIPQETATPALRTRPASKMPEMIPVTPLVPLKPGELYQPVVGEAPAQLLQKIQADLAKRIGVEVEAMVVVRAEAVTWSDGSLGCPQPDVFYTQALVPGYWVVLQVGEKEYDYRASERGSFLLCEGGGLPFSQPQDQ